MSKEKRKHKRAKIFPEEEGETTDGNYYSNSAMEMDHLTEGEENTQFSGTRTLERLKSAARKATLKENAIQVITNVKTGVSKWRKFVTSRRQLSSSIDRSIDRRKTGGMGLEYDIVHSDKLKDQADGVKRQMMAAQNRNLIEYFARLGTTDKDEAINLEYLESLIKSGASIDCTDKYGQTVFHEVARAWHVDVAKFLVEMKANINCQDNFGRTPLHVAAAVDYPEMVNFLIDNGANKEALTKGEKQTPLHFAARNDACQSLKVLVKRGCQYMEVRDYKGRTPLHVAAELDRSETSKYLLELPVPANAGVEDNSGQSAITWMVAKMPPVAKLALNQFHTTDRANRRQAYHLHKLEPQKPNDTRIGHPRTPMQIVVRYRRLDLITHSAFTQLISVKWHKYGMFGAVLQTVINMLFILCWTILGVLVEYDVRYIYNLPGQWWRIVLFILAVGLTAWQIKEELSEFINSKRMHTKWKEWRLKEIERDKKYTHPRWPEEERYLLSEIEDLDKQNPQYFNDFWNIFDWVCYALLLVVIITHLVDIFHHSNTLARVHIRIMAITIILIWIRLLKNFRAFSLLGPFIVMLTHMLADVLRFVFLYIEFYLPFGCAFWMLFGGDKTPEAYQGRPDAANHTVTVSGMNTVNALAFSLFRITLVDDYDYDGMKSVDSLMADLLVGAWLGLSAILMLNLFIALLSETFQRVYDNAQANAVMQKAITILSIEEGLSVKRRERFRSHIHTKCAPLVSDYDDDEVGQMGEDLQKVTIQIKEQLDDLEERIYNTSIGKPFRPSDQQKDNGKKGGSFSGPGVSDSRFKADMDALKEEVSLIRKSQKELSDRYRKDSKTMKDLLQQIAAYQLGAVSATPGDLAARPMSTQLMTPIPEHTGQYGGRVPAQYYPTSLPPVTTRPTQRMSRVRRSMPETSLEEDLAALDQQRNLELRELRLSLAQRAEESNWPTDQLSDTGVLSGSHLVVEVSDAGQPPTNTQDSSQA